MLLSLVVNSSPTDSVYDSVNTSGVFPFLLSDHKSVGTLTHVLLHVVTSGAEPEFLKNRGCRMGIQEKNSNIDLTLILSSFQLINGC